MFRHYDTASYKYLDFFDIHSIWVHILHWERKIFNGQFFFTNLVVILFLKYIIEYKLSISSSIINKHFILCQTTSFLFVNRVCSFSIFILGDPSGTMMYKIYYCWFLVNNYVDFILTILLDSSHKIFICVTYMLFFVPSISIIKILRNVLYVTYFQNRTLNFLIW